MGMPLIRIVVFLIASVSTGRAQFRAQFFQDDGYWGDGKAEFTTYDAQQVRYGTARPSEVLHILVREPFSNRELVKAEPGSAGGSFPVVKLNQILHIPTGVYVYQQMHSSFWRADSGRLVKATLTSNDSCGNTYKEFRALAGVSAWLGAGWRYEWRTYWEGMSAGEETVRAAGDAVFYDELPVRVRTIDFAPGRGEFAVPLARTIIGSKKDAVQFAPATVRWTAGAEGMVVEVVHVAGTDRFILESKPPHRLQEWQQADGGRLKLRRSVKIEYWKYNQPGDGRVLDAAPATP